MSTGRLPVVIGIDFGFTYTKVAASLPEGSRYSKTQPINWSSDTGLNYTLPTTVIYTTGGQVIIGLEIPEAKEQGLELFRHFKLKALRPESSRDALYSFSGKTQAPARTLLRDFLGCLRTRIQDVLCKEHNWQPVEWTKRDVDFLLSFPSMVGSEGAQIMFETASEIFNGGHGATHQVLNVTVSEAEAAGVCAVKSLRDRVKSGDTALVLDVGGGTSDLSMMTFVGRDNQWELDTVFLQPVSSDQLGGAHIDTALQSMIEHYLQEVHMHDGGHTPLDWQNMASRFTTQAEYLQAKAEQKPCTLAISDQEPGDQELGTTSALGGRFSGIYFDRRSLSVNGAVFTRLLDDQVYGTNCSGGIVSQVVAMRDDLFVRNPSRSVTGILYNKGNQHDTPDLSPDTLDMVIFSGGVGGSPRVQEKIEEALRAELSGDDIRLHNTTAQTSFLAHFSHLVQGAQLAVCQGLVDWRIPQVSTGNGGRTGQKKLVFRTWLQSKLGLS